MRRAWTSLAKAWHFARLAAYLLDPWWFHLQAWQTARASERAVHRVLPSVGVGSCRGRRAMRKFVWLFVCCGTVSSWPSQRKLRVIEICVTWSPMSLPLRRCRGAVSQRGAGGGWSECVTLPLYTSFTLPSRGAAHVVHDIHPGTEHVSTFAGASSWFATIAAARLATSFAWSQARIALAEPMPESA